MFFEEINSSFQIDTAKRTEPQAMNDTHFHNTYELYYLAVGELNYFIENAVYSVKKGDIILIPPNIIHKTQYHLECKRILISFSSEFISDLLKCDNSMLSCFNNRIISLQKQRQQSCENIINGISNEFSGIYEPNFALVKCLLGELLILLCRYSKNDKGIRDEKNIQPINPSSHRIMEIVEYINKEYKEDITLKLLSEKFFIGSTQLSKLFKKTTGLKYCEYLLNVRIKQAVYLLQSSELNITEIAFNVGFNSSNHFCKCFKALVGISPLKYRGSHLL